MRSNSALICAFRILTSSWLACRATTPIRLARCCCGLRGPVAVDYPNAGEMKRLFVRKPFRRLGLGRQLAEAVLDAARIAGYHCVLPDTLDYMELARALYVDLGFLAIPPYYHSPIAGAHYLKVDF